MAGPCNIVGKLAFLDGDCVRVNSFSSERNKCSVTRLPAPNQPGSDTTSEVALDSLQSIPAKLFSDKFHLAKRIRSTKISANEVAHGTIVELANNAQFKDPTPPQVWTITTSCRIVGEPWASTSPDRDTIEPTTFISSEVCVCLKNANDIVEFEDIEFREEEERSEYTLVCKAGRSITFRRCRFSRCKYGILVKAMYDGNMKRNRVKVYFEDCRFENSSAELLSVELGGQVHLLNCTFHSDVSTTGMLDDVEAAYSGDGIQVCAGGKLAAHYCSFSKLEHGISCSDKLSCAEVGNCYFDNVSNGVVGQSGSQITVNGCRVTDSEVAFSCVGPKRSTFYIDNCVIIGCKCGFNFSTGKNDSIVANCKVRCSMHCVFVLYDVVGYIDFVDCDMQNTDAGGDGVVVWSTNKSIVTIDHNRVQPKPLDVILAKAQKHTNAENAHLIDLRCCKRAGVYEIVCPHCSKVEPNEVHFKKCARCKNICYCSKLCQMAHWIKHKSKCDEAVKEDDEKVEEDKEKAL